MRVSRAATALSESHLHLIPFKLNTTSRSCIRALPFLLLSHTSPPPLTAPPPHPLPFSSPPFPFFFPFIFRLASLFHGVLLSSVNTTELPSQRGSTPISSSSALVLPVTPLLLIPPRFTHFTSQNEESAAGKGGQVLFRETNSRENSEGTLVEEEAYLYRAETSDYNMYFNCILPSLMVSV